MKKNSHTRLRARNLLLVALAVIFFTGIAQAQTISLMAPSIANDNGALKVRFGVTVVEMPILKGELEDGAELVLKCGIDIYAVSDYWLDSHIASTSLESVIKYEALTREFTLTLPGRSNPLRDTDLQALLKKGWGSIEAGLGAWNMLESGEKYSLELKTTINEVGAPEGFSRFIYFWSWDAGADNTFHLNFTF